MVLPLGNHVDRAVNGWLESGEQCYDMANAGTMGHRGGKVVPWHTTRAQDCCGISGQGVHSSSAKE